MHMILPALAHGISTQYCRMVLKKASCEVKAMSHIYAQNQDMTNVSDVGLMHHYIHSH